MWTGKLLTFHRDRVPAVQQGQEGELPHQGRAAVQAQGRRHPLPGLAAGAGQPPGAAGPGVKLLFVLRTAEQQLVAQGLVFKIQSLIDK